MRPHPERTAGRVADRRSPRSHVRTAHDGPERRTLRGRGLDRVSRLSTPAFRFLDCMITSFFHDWEHRLASVSKDRIVRPFEWGEDWVTSNGQHSHDARTRVANWVTEAMSDSQAFFDAPTTQDYQFEDAPAVVQRQGEAGTLHFPSALVTPHAVNNIVYARWFPAHAANVDRVLRSGSG